MDAIFPVDIPPTPSVIFLFLKYIQIFI